MRHLLAFTILTGVLTLGSTVAVQAAPGMSAISPASSAASADIVLVSGGCGPRGFRDRFGRCHARRPPPRHYRHRY